MDLFDIFAGADSFHIRRLLEHTRGLSDAQLDKPLDNPARVFPWDSPAQSLRELLRRLVSTKEIWTAALTGGSLSDLNTEPPDQRTPAALLSRLEKADVQFNRILADVRNRGAWSDTFVDALCEPPETFSFGGMFAHVITFNAYQRLLALDALRRLGVKVEGFGCPRSTKPAWRPHADSHTRHKSGRSEWEARSARVYRSVAREAPPLTREPIRWTASSTNWSVPAEPVTAGNASAHASRSDELHVWLSNIPPLTSQSVSLTITAFTGGIARPIHRLSGHSTSSVPPGAPAFRHHAQDDSELREPRGFRTFETEESHAAMAIRRVGDCIRLVGRGSPVFGQQGTGELRGQVVDAQSAVLPGVTVIATNEASGMFREIISGADGSFFMSALTPGVYEVTAQLTGFRKYRRAKASAWKSARRSRLTSRSRSGAHRGGDDRHRGVADRRHDLETAGRQRAARRAERDAVAQPEFHVVSGSRCPASRRRCRPTRSAPTPSASTGRRRRTRTTCSTAPATTTTSTTATAARRRGRRSRRCRSSSC